MKRVEPQEISGNAFVRIGKQWMLITAEKDGKVNTMTASWGGMGVLFERPVAFIFIRPQRYTYQFVEGSEVLTLSFLPETQRTALNICGKKSGRDCDKISEAGLTVVKDDGYFYFQQAKMVLCCRKLYAQNLSEDNFLVPDIAGQWYPGKDFHKMYIAEITGALVD